MYCFKGGFVDTHYYVVIFLCFCVALCLIKALDEFKETKGLYWSDYASNSKLAVQFYCDLLGKMMEMFNDPETTEKEWNDLVPICEEVDRWIIHAYPDHAVRSLVEVLNFTRLNR